MENLISQVDGVEMSREALDSQDIDKQFKEVEEQIHVSRKQSYLSSRNILNQDKEGKKEEATPWDQLDVPQLAEKLSCDHTKGLTSAQAQERLAQYGLNELEKAKRPGFCTLFLIQLLNLIILLLIAAAVASIAVNAASDTRNDPISYVEGIAIFVIVFLNAGIGAYTENQAAGALEALSKLSQPKATVLRDGKEISVKSTLMVPGDVVILGTGDIAPADVRLIDADDLKVNEMLLTGEPDDVSKFARMKKKKKAESGGGGHDEGEKLTPENMAFSSCMVTNGKAKAFVVETGMNTRVGKIAQLLSQSGSNANDNGSVRSGGTVKKKKCNCCACLPDTKSNQTPLQRSLQDLGVNIGIFAIVVCLLVFIIGVALEVTDLNNPSRPTWLYMILIAVTLAVAAIPEGIPLCVTISLSTGCSDMVKKNVLVRRIAAVETLGCASVICTDKTGTLTEGKMTMVKMWSGNVDYNVSGKGFNPTVGNITYEQNGEDAAAALGVQSTLASALLCCNTTVKEELVDGENKWVPYGNSSEAPIVVAAAKVGLWATELEKTVPRLYEVPFASSRKMMLTVCAMKPEGSMDDSVARSKLAPFFQAETTPNYIGNVKGAPNFILDLCDSWTNAEGTIVPLTDEDRSNFLKKVDNLSSQALRVLAVAARTMTELPFDPKDKDLEWTTDQKFDSIVKQPGLTLLGLVASIDPERDGVAQSVLDAHGGHIRVIMITGDYLPTAVAIAHNVNILKPEDDVSSCALDCKGLRPNGDYLDNDGIDNLTRTIKVFARAQPEDKLEIVKSLQRQGLVSAMTGDGVNDAPALKRADIGVAMGIQGTEVAKGASDMILTDDNFVSIVTAVEKGRIIYAGIQKFVAFILSVHLAEVVQIFLCIVAQIPIMRTPLQILFLILVTDLPPSIALGMERAAPGILQQRPRPKKQPIVLNWMWLGVFANGIILTITTLAVYIWGLSFYLDNRYNVNDILKYINEQGSNNCTMTEPFDPITEKSCRIISLDLARTSAFISLVWSENVRAYTSRSFSKPVWVDLCGNPAMQKAIFLAQVALYVAVFVPGLSELILNLRGYQIGGEGWLAGFLGALGTLFLCEIYKVISGPCIKNQEKKTAEQAYQAEQKRLQEMAERQQSMQKTKESAASMTAPQKA